MYKAVVLTIALFIATANAVDYCTISGCKVPRTHTLCLYPRSGPSSNCNNVIYTGLNDQEKQRILDLHNSLRSKVASGRESRGLYGRPQPAARNLKQLQWDNDLAFVAQRWADQCTYNHDNCHVTEKFDSVGQNIARARKIKVVSDSYGEPSVSRFNIDSMVQAWYDEVKDYDPSELSRYISKSNVHGKTTGHYTQFVSARTTHVGCGISVTRPQFEHRDGSYNVKTEAILVCNYGPAGNVKSLPIYEAVQ